MLNESFSIHCTQYALWYPVSAGGERETARITQSCRLVISNFTLGDVPATPHLKYEYTHSHAQITSHTAHIAHPYLRHVTHTATCTCTPRHTHTEMYTQQKENMSYTSEQNYTLQRAVVFTGFLRIVRMSTVVLGGTISRSLRARALCRVGPAYGSTIQ